MLVAWYNVFGVDNDVKDVSKVFVDVVNRIEEAFSLDERVILVEV